MVERFCIQTRHEFGLLFTCRWRLFGWKSPATVHASAKTVDSRSRVARAAGAGAGVTRSRQARRATMDERVSRDPTNFSRQFVAAKMWCARISEVPVRRLSLPSKSPRTSLFLQRLPSQSSGSPLHAEHSRLLFPGCGTACHRRLRLNPSLATFRTRLETFLFT